MCRFVLAATLCFAGLCAQAAELKLSGAEIRTTLAGHVVKGAGNNGDWSQDFEARGATTYSQGNSNSPGLWDVRGDQYCSAWPPNKSWSCYDVMLDGTGIAFVGKDGDRSSGVLVK
jgi:hypothetical protein